MTCGACGRKAKKLWEWGLCGRCYAVAEKAIQRWWIGIEMDLSLIERFDAYCAERDQRSPTPSG